jgi:hypothetical protein
MLDPVDTPRKEKPFVSSQVEKRAEVEKRAQAE